MTSHINHAIFQWLRHAKMALVAHHDDRSEVCCLMKEPQCGFQRHCHTSQYLQSNAIALPIAYVWFAYDGLLHRIP